MLSTAAELSGVMKEKDCRKIVEKYFMSKTFSSKMQHLEITSLHFGDI